MCRPLMFRAAVRVRSEGQGLVEYALIILLMAVALATALGLFKDGIQSGIQSAVTALS